MRPTSPTGSRNHAGYTLAELLVVLAIIGAVASLAIPMVTRLAGPRLDAQAEAVGAVLREARSRAIGENRAFVVTIDTAGGTVTGAGGRTVVNVPPEVSVGLVAASTEQVDSTTGRIRFMPDGSASGGAIVLERDGLRTVVEVDWFDGSVERHAGE